jgi:WD40 repeat protein
MSLPLSPARGIARTTGLAFLGVLTGLGLVCGRAAPADKPDDDKVRQEVRKLIGQLDDDSPEKRDAASKRLEEIGEPALPLLRDAAENGTGAETRVRARALIKAIEKSAFGEVARWDGHETNVGLPWVTRIAQTPDGSQVITSGADGLRVWDVKTGKTVQTFGTPREAGYWALAVSADGKRVISGGNDQIAHVWDLKTGKELKQLTGHTGPIWGAVLSADGKRAVTGGWDKSLRLWDVEAGKELKLFAGVKENVRCLALSPDGKMVAAGHFDDQARGVVRLWNFDDGKEVRAFQGHTQEVSAVAFSPDGKKLVSSSFDKTVRVWEVATGKELKVLEGHTGRVETVAFTPDGKRVISAGHELDATVRVWDVATGKQLFCSEGTGGGFLGIAVLPGGKQFVTTGKDGAVRLWRLTK